MKVSIITTSFNSQNSILQTIKSVNKQTYKNIEHIFIDGNSSDNTIDIIKKNSLVKKKIISEKDSGAYDAMNKGINISKGEIIFIINSDDIFFNNMIVEKVVKIFKKHKDLDLLYGNLLIIKKKKVFRKWIADHYKKNIFYEGWIPPHPTFVVKKKIYNKYGKFNLKYKIAADIDLMFRFLEKFNLKFYYLNNFMVKMQHGGISSRNFKNTLKQNLENITILNDNYNFKLMRFLFKKLIHRIKQFNV